MPSTSIADYSAAEITQLLESFSSGAAAKLLAAAPPEAKAAAAAALLNVRNTSRLQARVAELEQLLERREQQLNDLTAAAHAQVKSESELLDRTLVRFERLCTINNQLTSQLNDLTRKYNELALRRTRRRDSMARGFE